MSHYLKEHLDAVGELPKKLRETMASIGTLDDRCQKISEMIDRDVGEVARARKRYYENFEKGDSPPCNKSKVRPYRSCHQSSDVFTIRTWSRFFPFSK